MQIIHSNVPSSNHYWCSVLYLLTQVVYMYMYFLLHSCNSSCFDWFLLCSSDPPSPPRNLRCSVIGVYSDREYRVRWSASSYTGGLPVNYSIKLCLNTSMESETICNILNLDDLDCRPENVLTTDFLCVLKKREDFIPGYGKTYNYTISVVAENAVGSATSWRYVPFVPDRLGNCF